MSIGMTAHRRLMHLPLLVLSSNACLVFYAFGRYLFASTEGGVCTNGVSRYEAVMSWQSYLQLAFIEVVHLRRLKPCSFPRMCFQGCRPTSG